jgi:hypothetical protein
MDYLFNFSFTRPDENNAHVYEVGMHVCAPDYATAEQRLRQRTAHLTLLTVALFATLPDDN